MASWIVSNCRATSKRNALVEKLQSYINVDVFGKCGNLTCSKSSIFRVEQCTAPYKFYLSFENSLCPHYVTEKVYKVMSGFIIPVVFNGANMSNFLPPKSYINVNDFATVEDLANYLKFLSENPKEYVKYFWWKKHYKVSVCYHYDFPEACNKIVAWSKSSDTNTYEDIKGWYTEGCNKKPRIKFQEFWEL